jgi:hypothetical protein
MSLVGREAPTSGRAGAAPAPEVLELLTAWSRPLLMLPGPLRAHRHSKQGAQQLLNADGKTLAADEAGLARRRWRRFLT